MTTRKIATQKILSFLQSKEKFLLLTGTHQFQKHVLALSIIFGNYPAPATILFRVNHLDNATIFVSPVLNLTKRPRPGVPITVNNYALYVDSMNPKSWHSTPSNVDVAIVYPIDSLDYDSGDDCVQDLIKRKAKKILLVSCTDNVDFGWVDQFNPIHVVFDAEEENPEYHKRVLEMLKSQPLMGTGIDISKLPEYARSAPERYLVRIFCRNCRCVRWAKLNAPYPGKSALRSAPSGKYEATCLVCGYMATDNYNWCR
ncbi:MAG: hypothetical protein QXP36_01920 [Conexivisphaerales archaeon]